MQKKEGGEGARIRNDSQAIAKLLMRKDQLITLHVWSKEPWNPTKPLEATPQVTYCRYGEDRWLHLLEFHFA